MFGTTKTDFKKVEKIRIPIAIRHLVMPALDTRAICHTPAKMSTSLVFIWRLESANSNSNQARL